MLSTIKDVSTIYKWEFSDNLNIIFVKDFLIKFADAYYKKDKENIAQKVKFMAIGIRLGCTLLNHPKSFEC